jgi:uncharacterized protein (TIGR02271 family)
MQTVISAFDDYQGAERAVERLVEAGFSRGDVHIERGDQAELFSAEQARTTTGDGTRGEYENRGVLSSIGHFFTSLFGMDTPESDAHTYTEAVRRGSSVVVVDVNDEPQAERAVSIMQEMGAVDVDERANQWRAAGWSGGRMDAGRERTPASEGGVAGDRDKVLDVVQEELQVGKRQMDRGGVRVIQRVSEKPVHELIRLRDERAVVERREVDRPASEADLANFGQGAIELRETTEEPVVAKQARVVEEVRVGKQVQERTETIDDTVRRKDVDVERLEGEAGAERVERERAYAAGERSGSREPLNERGDAAADRTPGDPRDKPTRRT